MPLDVLVEGFLFYTAVPQSKDKVQKLFACGEQELDAALDVLHARLQPGATRLLETATELQLVTAPELSAFIGSVRKGELSADIGQAGAETLAIILYREPITRSEIDEIRGVNSSSILRNLLTRGLIERHPIKNTHEFRVTAQLLQHLGVNHKQQLPQFGAFLEKIDTFTSDQKIAANHSV